jgi:hypothetical protein
MAAPLPLLDFRNDFLLKDLLHGPAWGMDRLSFRLLHPRDELLLMILTPSGVKSVAPHFVPEPDASQFLVSLLGGDEAASKPLSHAQDFRALLILHGKLGMGYALH